jgi:hypothetical protein
MTDLTPNDLSQLSDEEFNALCPQGHHAPGSAQPLSPAAQAVKDAVLALYSDQPQIRDWGWQLDAPTVTAALRAAADQVAPIPPLPYDSCCDVHAAAVRAELLAIAAELEAQ